MADHKRLNIIARYNEDLDWVKNLNGDVLVYNKGENYRWDYKKIDAENYGRESETYVRAIIEHYDILDQYYDVVFLQGHPFDHAPELYENLRYSTEEFLPLCSYFATHVLPNDNYVFDTHKFVIDILCRQSQVDHGTELTPLVSDFSYPMEHGDGRVIEKSCELKQLLYVMQIMGLPSKNVKLDWTCGAMYTVNSKLLKQKSLSWWKNFHELIRYWYVDINNHDLGYILERLWPVVWKHADNFGGWKF